VVGLDNFATGYQPSHNIAKGLDKAMGWYAVALGGLMFSTTNQ